MFKFQSLVIVGFLNSILGSYANSEWFHCTMDRSELLAQGEIPKPGCRISHSTVGDYCELTEEFKMTTEDPCVVLKKTRANVCYDHGNKSFGIVALDMNEDVMSQKMIGSCGRDMDLKAPPKKFTLGLSANHSGYSTPGVVISMRCHLDAGSDSHDR